MQFIKQNPVLAAGIFLPVLLVILFLLASSIPKLLVDPPQYSFLFTARDYQRDNHMDIRFRVVNHQLVTEYHYTKEPSYNNQALYLYDAKTQAVRKIDLDIPANTSKQTEKDWQPVHVEEFANAPIDPSSKAPDGYEFAGRHYRGGGDLSGMFYRSRHHDASIRKDGRVVRIPRTNGDYYYSYDLEFLGWISTAQGEKQ